MTTPRMKSVKEPELSREKIDHIYPCHALQVELPKQAEQKVTGPEVG